MNIEHRQPVAPSEVIIRAETSAVPEFVAPGVPQDLLNDVLSRSVNLRPRPATWQEMPNAWKPGPRKAEGDKELQ